MNKNSLQILINDQKCDLCGTCVGVCPENVMGMSVNKLFINDAGCTHCSKCVWVCPVRALSLEARITEFAGHTDIEENN